MVLTEYLTKDKLYDSISQEEIFKRYIPNFKSVGTKFKSDLRDDPQPSCIITPYNGVLWYKDFGTDNKAVDAIGYVRLKYGLDYNDSLHYIANEFNYLESNTTKSLPKIEDSNTKYEFKVRNYQPRDFEYWGKYSLEEEDLKFFDIYPIQWLRIIKNGRVVVVREELMYVYIIDKGIYKFLSPYSEYKWLSNCKSDTFQGYNQLPWTGELLLITKALKDVAVLRKLGYYSIAPQSEQQPITKSFTSLLKRRFNQLVVFYDNDSPGLSGANKLCITHELKNIIIPIETNIKDISDYVKYRGLDEASILMKQLLNESIGNN